MLEMHCIVSGRVQNVAYRVYAQDAATELGVCGWVRNCEDGTVEVCAQANPDTLKEYVEYLHEGSLASVVETVAIDWESPKIVYDDFSIYHE